MSILDLEPNLATVIGIATFLYLQDWCQGRLWLWKEPIQQPCIEMPQKKYVQITLLVAIDYYVIIGLSDSALGKLKEGFCHETIFIRPSTRANNTSILYLKR